MKTHYYRRFWFWSIVFALVGCQSGSTVRKAFDVDFGSNSDIATDLVETMPTPDVYDKGTEYCSQVPNNPIKPVNLRVPHWFVSADGHRQRLVSQNASICGAGKTGSLSCWGNGDLTNTQPISGTDWAPDSIYPVVTVLIPDVVDISMLEVNMVFPLAVDVAGIAWWWYYCCSWDGYPFPVGSAHTEGTPVPLDFGNSVLQAAVGAPVLVEGVTEGEYVEVPSIMARVKPGIIVGMSKHWDYLGKPGRGFNDSDVPYADIVPGVDDFVQLRSGWSYFCGIRRNHEVVCWGFGDGFPAAYNECEGYSPHSIPELEGSVDMSLAADSGCAVKSDHSLWCWGTTESPDYSTDECPVGHGVPKLVSCVTDAVSVTISMSGFRCVLHQDGSVSCVYPQFEGIDEPPPSDYYPASWPGTKVVGLPEPIIEVASSYECACALGESDAVYCWGESLCRGEASDGKWSDEAVLVTRLK